MAVSKLGAAGLAKILVELALAKSQASGGKPSSGHGFEPDTKGEVSGEGEVSLSGEAQVALGQSKLCCSLHR